MMRSRTIWVAALIAMLGVVEASTDVLKPLLTEKTFGLVMIIVAVVMAGLRVVTTQPLEQRNRKVKAK